jgi:NurA-like 5'-3' nuclease
VLELISPLTFVSEDPRCLGYPVPLYLAHRFSAPAEAMLLNYPDQIERILKQARMS